MTYLTPHLIMLPVLLPLIAGALMVLINERHHRLKFSINLFSTTAMLLSAIQLLIQAQSGVWPADMAVYLAANWSAPFGIVLVADRLAAIMLLLTATLGAATLVFSYSRWSKTGVHFHTLFQLLLMGINGAILTADLFNLFVFFEVLLIASYSLLIHGGGKAKTKAAVHYVILNLVGSALFLFALALIYGASGTLNMLDLGTKVASLSETQLQLLQAAVALLLVVFGLKAAVMPLHFWLGNAYSSASPAVAALFAIMTKVGIYSLLRVFAMVLQDAGFVASWVFPVLWWTGLLTIVMGVLGVLASEDLRKMASYLVIVSVGALVAILSLGTPESVQALLYYLVHSTLATAALFLLADLISNQRGKAGDGGGGDGQHDMPEIIERLVDRRHRGEPV